MNTLVENRMFRKLQIKLPEQSAFYVDWKILYPFQYYELYVNNTLILSHFHYCILS